MGVRRQQVPWDFSLKFEHFCYFLSTQLLSPLVDLRDFPSSEAIAIYNPQISTPCSPSLRGVWGVPSRARGVSFRGGRGHGGLGPRVGGRRRARVCVAARALAGSRGGGSGGSGGPEDGAPAGAVGLERRAPRGRPGAGEPPREAGEPPGSGGGRHRPGQRGQRPAGPRMAARGRCGRPLAGAPPPGRRGRALPAAAAAAAAWAAPCPRWILRRRRRELDADGARAGPWGSSASRTRSALQPFPPPPSRAGRRRHASPGMCGLGRAQARSSRGARPAPRSPPPSRCPWGPGDGGDAARGPCSREPGGGPLRAAPPPAAPAPRPARAPALDAALPAAAPGPGHLQPRCGGGALPPLAEGEHQRAGERRSGGGRAGHPAPGSDSSPPARGAPGSPFG